MTDREMIEARCKAEGLRISEWDEEHENGLTAKCGRYEVVSRDTDEEGPYVGDEGVLEVCVVGSAEYKNQSVSFSLLVDGYDMSYDVDDLSDLEPVV
jgi:hypothetical protein